jgi:bacteriocin-like protein
MSDEAKKPEEIKDAHLPVKELSSEELKQVAGGKPQIADGDLYAGIHFKYDIKVP